MTRILSELEELTAPLEWFKPDPKNARVHDAASIAAIRGSLETFGQVKPIVCLADGTVIAGNGVLEAAGQLGWDRLARVVFEDREKARAFAIADNRVAELSYFDESLLREAVAEVAHTDVADLGALGFSRSQLDELLGDLEAVSAPNLEDLTPDPTPSSSPPVEVLEEGQGEEAPQSARVVVERDERAEAVPQVSDVPKRARRGDIWRLGDHLIYCGDSTLPRIRDYFREAGEPDAILSDPPYCSGGWQEAGRAKGSAGGDLRISNDNLSTRGYQDLMRRTLRNFELPVVYLFTDWRMWINLWDAVESCGYGIRQMIVWDKGTPGIGMGWRAQHEIVMLGLSGSSVFTKFDPHKAQGNVIGAKVTKKQLLAELDAWYEAQRAAIEAGLKTGESGDVVLAKRTGNKHHSTEKPVELLEKIIRITDFAKRWLDPFLGSGSTLIAAEKAGVPCYGCELDPGYVNVALHRWEQLTEREAERLEEGNE